MKTYLIRSPFKTVSLNVSRKDCFVLDGFRKIVFNRSEAANCIRYARLVNGSVSLVK